MTNQSSETKRVLRFFWAWQDDDEGRWLAQMARQGWHLVKGGIWFTFRRGEPREVLYRMDFRTKEEPDRGEYLRVFRDAGWEHVCNFGPWRYFRADAAAAASDIYSDTHSLIGKYKRLIRVLAVFGVVNLIGLANNLPWFFPDHFNTSLMGIIGIVFPILGILLVAYVISRLWMRIAQIKRSAQ